MDITFATPALAARASDWRVLEDVETLSDHPLHKDDCLHFATHDEHRLRRIARNTACGVPQGSVLGPLLWNLG